ncbi:exo-alpha-sialidase [Paenibacillus xylanivorans]|nr:exo-alpha-sialidase [Paenibacillus xylanivorans]
MKIMAAWFAGKHEKAIDVAIRVLGRQEGSRTVPLRLDR